MLALSVGTFWTSFGADLDIMVSLWTQVCHKIFQYLDENEGMDGNFGIDEKEFTNRMFDCDRCPLRRAEPSQLRVRICSMNMAHQAAPPEAGLKQWLCQSVPDQSVPDIVIVGVQDAINTGASKTEVELATITLTIESMSPGDGIRVRLRTKPASEDETIEELIHPAEAKEENKAYATQHTTTFPSVACLVYLLL